ncbi:hypothetical protein ASB65_15950 [Agrobacterium tumefaciens str. B6]|nr:hypothetical protein ASB65_15950 [Agrobacterium tumefaciens str. B6]OCJ39582.1 hypothetical protein A6U90_20010 [Agrobacterium tumefaciens]
MASTIASGVVCGERDEGLLDKIGKWHDAWVTAFVDQIGVHPRRCDFLHPNAGVAQLKTAATEQRNEALLWSPSRSRYLFGLPL